MSTYTQQYTRPYENGYVDRPDESTPEYARFINARDDALIRIEAFLAALNIPEKLSELVNDEGFIKNTVSNLANYYLKSETYARTETYTKAEVQALIADAVSKVSGKLNISVVDALPTSDISTTAFYLVPKETAQEKNLYDEYINTDGTVDGWEFIGGVSTSIDLSDYYKKSEVDALLEGKMNKADIVPSKFEGTKVVVGNQVPSGGGTYVVSDLDYSTEEQLTGRRWVNGKPIYIKTLNIASISSGTTTIAVENIEDLISYDGRITISDTQRPFPFSQNGLTSKALINECYGGNIHIISNWDATDLKVNIKYTKTTDTASSPVAPPKVEAMHVYSTEEKVVGTSYNGKPIYERTFLNIPVENLNQWTFLTNDGNIEELFDESGCVIRDNEPIPYGIFSTTIYSACIIRNNNIAVTMHGEAGESYYFKHFTVQYTKTTDTATA